MLMASACDAESGELLIGAIPTARSGIILAHDWDNIGQRQTDSGSTTFERVRVEDHELLLDPGPLGTPFACLRPLIAQLIFCHVFLGLAKAVSRRRGITRSRKPAAGSAPAWSISVMIPMCWPVTASSDWDWKVSGLWSSRPPTSWIRPGTKARA